MKSNKEKMKVTCLVSNCPDEPHAKGYCCKHYHKVARYGNPTHIPDPVETKRKQSAAAKGRIPWCKGKTGVFSKEVLRKMSEFQKKNTKNHFKKGNLNPMYGKKHTEETKMIISLANTGRKHTEKSRENMSKGQKGKILSETARRNISESKKGNLNPMYGKKGELAPMFGRKASEETRRKQSIFSKEFHNRPEEKKRSRENLRKARKNMVKPNKPESQIGKILENAGIRFKFHPVLTYQTCEDEQGDKEVDVLIGSKKIIEYNGYYHFDKRKFKPDDIVTRHNQPTIVRDVWEEEKKIINQLKKQDYKVLVIWEMDWKQNPEKITKKILKFAHA